MAVTDLSQAKGLASRVKRQTRNSEWLDLCEYVLMLDKERMVMPNPPESRADNTMPPLIPEPSAGAISCPACEARRLARNKAMKRWRQGRKQGKN